MWEGLIKHKYTHQIFAWARFDRGEDGDGMQFNLGFNNVPSWGHMKQKDAVFVSTDNHTDRVYQSQIKQEEPTSPVPTLPETVPWHCPIPVLPY